MKELWNRGNALRVASGINSGQGEGKMSTILRIRSMNSRWGLLLSLLVGFIPLESHSAHLHAKLSASRGPRTLLAGVSAKVSFSLIVADACDQGAACPTRRILVQVVRDSVEIISQLEVLVPPGTLLDTSEMVYIAIRYEGMHCLELRAMENVLDSVLNMNGSSPILASERLGDVRVIPPMLCILPSVAIIVAAVATRYAYKYAETSVRT